MTCKALPYTCMYTPLLRTKMQMRAAETREEQGIRNGAELNVAMQEMYWSREQVARERVGLMLDDE